MLSSGVSDLCRDAFLALPGESRKLKPCGAVAARASIVASPFLDKTELTTVCGSGADDLLKDDSAPPASSFALADKCPIVKLLFDASESPSAFRTFLHEAVDVSCEPARRELVTSDSPSMV